MPSDSVVIKQSHVSLKCPTYIIICIERIVYHEVQLINGIDVNVIGIIDFCVINNQETERL
uniref:Uncharacterized protein n=1 Tax=Lepeophtheirus salmonis TaxID=72036 RepID=A0A0K2TMU7_LEPSM